MVDIAQRPVERQTLVATKLPLGIGTFLFYGSPDVKFSPPLLLWAELA